MAFRFLTYLLLALMAVQPVIAASDVHSAHQSGIEHQAFDGHDHESHEHGHNHSHNEFSEESDCHHCCCCHGHTSSAIVTNNLIVSQPNSLHRNSAYLADIAPEPLTNFLRPPISKT